MIGLDIAASLAASLPDSGPSGPSGPLSPPACSPPPSPLPTSACGVHPVKDAAVEGRLMFITSPGARSTGVVGPSSVPLDRCISIRTLVSVLLVVFSTVPMKALDAES